jgi:hypothetical protein
MYQNQKQPNPERRGIWYMWIVRIAAFSSAPALWWVSYTFSVAGFAFLLPEWRYVGQIFGVVFTILELMFNRGVSKHPTLFYAGIFAYCYSIATNFLGLLAASDLSIIHGPTLIVSILVLVICAFGLDILPESMFVWSLFPNEPIVTGDFVTNLKNGIQNGGGGQFQSKADKSQRPASVFAFGQKNDTIFDAGLSETDGRTDVRTSDGQRNATEKLVRSYVYRNRKPGGEFPSVRDVAKAIGKDKSTVGDIMARMRRQ